MSRPVVITTVLLFVLAAGVAGAAPGCRPADELAAALLEGGEGGLDVTAAFVVDETASDGERLVVTVVIDLGRDALRRLVGPGGWTPLCLGLVLDDGERLRGAYQYPFEAAEIAGGEGFRFAVELVLPGEIEQILAVVEAPRLGLWGGAPAEAGDDPIEPGPGAVRMPGRQRVWWRLAGPATTTAEVPPPVPAAGAAVVRLVPPREEPATGSERVYALTSSPAVARVEFYLDGEKAGEGRRRPFRAVVDLARPARPQLLRAVARDRDGNVLGEDELVLNRLDAPFRVRITELSGDPGSGAVQLAAEVRVPLDAELAAVELYRGDELVERFSEPSFRVRVATPSAGPSDFLRVAATLADGRVIDDVVLLASPGLSEELEVNLVALYAVVTDSRGVPIPDLEAADFQLRLRGEPRPIETFSYADDVPLALGLAIDASGSMFQVMPDTRRAAARFLQETMRDGDRGFVADFKERPRLLHETTGDVVALLGTLGRLEAEGLTSLYDAVIFSLLELERQGGRRALVVLSDGADRDSRFGPGDCVDYGQRLGVPIYLIALDNQQGSKIPKRELRRVADETGGRFYAISEIADLGPVYAQINAELRSQYALGFYAAEDLAPRDRRALELAVKRRDAAVRVVVGAGR